MDYWKEMPGGLERCDYSPLYRYVCPACVTDRYLAEALAAELEDEPCSYCDAAKAAHISVICDEISKTIPLDYVDPAEVLPYDSSEGGYQGVLLHLPWTELGV